MWDLHTHLVPSGDDGVDSLAEALALAREARQRGTRVLYATPHVNADSPLDAERLDAVRRRHAELAGALAPTGLELRLGWEVAAPLVDAVDPDTVALAGLDAILVEAPLDVHGWSLGDALDACAFVADLGYRPLLAHPERCPQFARRPGAAREVAELGGAVQLVAGSLVGGFGPDAARAAWAVVEAGLPAVAGSDAHGRHHPPHLDEAHRLVVSRAGRRRGDEIFGAAWARERAARRPGGARGRAEPAPRDARDGDRRAPRDRPRSAAGAARPGR